MNTRFQCGGDKYESIMQDDRRAFFDRVDAEQQEIIAALKSTVSTWTENEFEAGNTPMIERFLDEYLEWDHDQLYKTIEGEMKRVYELLRPSQTIQGA